MNQYTKPYYFLYTLPIALWGTFNDLPNAIILAEIAFSLLCIYSDYYRDGRKITFITIYSIFTIVYSYGNYMVVNSIGTADELVYDYYLVKENISEGLFFTYIANVFCVLGFYYYQRRFKKVIGPFYVMRIDLNRKWVGYVNAVVIIGNFLSLTGYVPYLLFSPFLIAFMFFLTRYAIAKEDNWLLSMCIANTFVLSINGLLFDYLRMGTIAPCIAFLIAAFMGKQDIATMFKKALLPVYGLLVSTIIVFSFLGQIRNKASGFEKLTGVMDELNRTVLKEGVQEESDEEEESFEARVSNVNQTSQVVKVVKEDGYYNGSTIAYLSYAFIPRFLWKEKPIIAQGVWFALRIGKAYVHEGGGANNSINMTSAGELYMNFGLMGVVAGMFIIGGICAYMWQISGFTDSVENVLGGMFGLYLFYLATSTFGIDLQFCVTMISYFCIFQVANYLYLYFLNSQRTTHA